MLNIKFNHHKGTQCLDTGTYTFYNKTFSSIVKVADLLRDITPGELIFVRYKSKSCVYDLELEAVYYKKEWIYVPKSKLRTA